MDVANTSSTSSEPRVPLSKDDIEIRKILLETPKIIVTIIAFLATSAAILLRFDANGGSPTFSKYFYGIGVVLTIVCLVFTYNYVTKIIASVRGRPEGKTEAKSIEEFLGTNYSQMMFWVSISVIYWILALLLFVFIN